MAGGINIFGNAGPELFASMKEKSASLTKIGGGVQNGTSNSNEGSVPKKKSFGKGTAAPSHPKPKAPSLPHESNKPTEHRNSRNLSSGGKLNVKHISLFGMLACSSMFTYRSYPPVKFK